MAAGRDTSSKVVKSRRKSNRVGTERKPTDSKFRSRYEERVATYFSSQNLQYEYESESFKYNDPIVKGVCLDCGGKHTAQVRTYTPDFALKNAAGNTAFFIETKGLFTSENRTTLLAMQKDHPEVDVRLLFMRDNKLHKASPTKYSDWCAKHGFKCAFGEEIPSEWLEELRC